MCVMIDYIEGIVRKIGQVLSKKKGRKERDGAEDKKTNKQTYIYIYQIKNKWFISSIKKIRRLRHTIHFFVI